MSLVDNPILEGCYPDPSVCRVGGDYYLVTSTFEYFPGLPVFHSTDLVHWEPIGAVITRAGQLDYAGIASSGGLYAPTIRHHDGRFWVVCTLVDPADAERGGNFLVTATDPAGPWSDPVWLGGAGIDPSLFFDDDGRAWLHGTRLARQPQWHDQTEVWVREFDLATLAPVGPETVIWHGAMLGVVWAEAPHLYKVDGTYYLLAAEGGTDFHHSVCVARSASVTGPYESNRCNPVLTHRHLGRDVDVVGVGHADLVEALDGSWWAVLLAMRPHGGYHYPLGRETFLVPVVWEDSWPVFAPGVGRVAGQVEVPFASPRERGPGRDGSHGLIPPSDPRWTSLRGPASTFATATDTGWLLLLTADSLTDPGTPAFLGVRQQHRDLDLRALLRVPLRPGEEAGLVVRQSEQDHVRLAVIGEEDGTRTVRAIHRKAGVESVLAETAAEGESLELGLRARGDDYQLLLGAVPVATADARTLDSAATGGFLGLWLGVYGTTNGGPPGTVVEVASFEYCPVEASHD